MVEVCDVEQELRAWHDKAVTQKEEIPNSRLYHYTSVESFCGILATGQLWMTSYRHLTDPTEYFYSDDLIKECLSESKSNINSEEYSILNTYLGFEGGPADKASPFVLSFSEECDSLYQWRAYADDGAGVSIGIEPSLDGDRYYRNLTKVVYRRNDQQRLIQQVIHEYIQICEKYRGCKVDAFKTTFQLYLAIMHLRIGFKHEAYSIEREWRYANYPMGFQTKFRWEKRRGLVEYFPDGKYQNQDGLLPIREIWLGAKIDVGHGMEYVKKLLAQHNYNPELILIRQSKVPLR